MSQSPRGSSRSKKQSDEQEQDPDKRVARSFYIRRELLGRARNATTYCAAYVPESQVRSLSDLIEPALEKVIAELETTYYGGEPFPEVGVMPTGRPRH